MKDEEAYEAALDRAPRDDAGMADIKAIIDEVVELMEFDAEAEKRNKAKRIVERHKRPGATQPDGRVCIPGLEEYGYEPNRLVGDNEGRVIEQYRCQPRHKQAEAERARVNAKRAGMHANRKTTEAEAYAAWFIEQLTAGRTADALNFHTFLMEAGYWRDGPLDVPDEPEPSVADD